MTIVRELVEVVEVTRSGAEYSGFIREVEGLEEGSTGMGWSEH